MTAGQVKWLVNACQKFVLPMIHPLSQTTESISILTITCREGEDKMAYLLNNYLELLEEA